MQCMPIIFMTHRSFSVILSSHIGKPSEFVSVMTDGPMYIGIDWNTLYFMPWARSTPVNCRGLHSVFIINFNAISTRHFALLKLQKVTLVSSEEITIHVIVYVQNESETTGQNGKRKFEKRSITKAVVMWIFRQEDKPLIECNHFDKILWALWTLRTLTIVANVNKVEADERRLLFQIT